MTFEKLKDGVAAVFGVIFIFGGFIFGGYLYISHNIETDISSKPSCDVSSSAMISLINKHRIDKGMAPVTEAVTLDNVAKKLSDSDALTNSITYSTAQITQATSAANYQARGNVTYQVFPSTDSTVNTYIFKEMKNTAAFNNALLDSSTSKVGVYSNCSTASRTVTIKEDSAAQSNINGQQFKVNTLTYLVYDN